MWWGRAYALCANQCGAQDAEVCLGPLRGEEIKIWWYQRNRIVPITWARSMEQSVVVGSHCLFAGTVPQSGLHKGGRHETIDIRNAPHGKLLSPTRVGPNRD